jgi:hypothetical protein
MALQAIKPNEDAPQPRGAKPSGLSGMGLRPTNGHEKRFESQVHLIDWTRVGRGQGGNG